MRIKSEARIKSKARSKRETVDSGTGDVFVDLGFADAGERKLRVQLAMQINELLADYHLTQAKAAALLGIPQPHVSDLKRYKLSRFSSERLLRFLTLLDRDVEIVIRPKARRRAAGTLSARCRLLRPPPISLYLRCPSIGYLIAVG